jgi:hypothetical protein
LLKLAKHQQALERDLNTTFLDLSAVETIRKCLVLGHKARANELRKDMGLSEKLFGCLELDMMVQNEQWDQMERFPKVKKVGGPLVVVDCMMRAGYAFEAQKWIDTIAKPGSAQHKELGARVEMWQARFNTSRSRAPSQENKGAARG